MTGFFFSFRLYSASADKTVKSWDLKKKEILYSFEGHEDWVNSLKVFEDVLFTGSRDLTAKCWSTKNGNCLFTFKGHENSIRTIDVDWMAGTLCTAGKDKTVRGWDIEVSNYFWKEIAYIDFIFEDWKTKICY